MQTKLGRMRRMLVTGAMAVWALSLTISAAVAASPEEIRQAHRWADVAFARPRVATVPDDALAVVDRSHYVLTNRSAWNTPLTLGDRQYQHGIYMDAPAAVRVRLGRPAAEFTAQVGIDNNYSTRGNPEAGSARFHVVVDGERVLSTPVCKLATGATDVKVSLKGAREFLLEVDDGGNGRGWDQCDWADATVKLGDGKTLFLDELPLRAGPSTRRLGVPFSFTYDGKPSDDFLDAWEHSSQTLPAQNGSRELIAYKDPATGLLVEVELTRYRDAAAVDWVLYLSNTGNEKTPIIEQLLPLDTATLFDLDPIEGPVTLRWSNGDRCAADSFLPHDEVLEQEKPRRLEGESSNVACFPFFNVQGPGGGWVLAVGWTGRWMAEFLHDAAGGVTLRAGMQRTHFRLRPGERVRTPRIVLLRWDGNEMIRGHNQFRRMMLDHYVQHRNGKPALPPVAHNTVAGLYRRAKKSGKPLGRLNEQGELAVIPKAAAVGCEAYWMDAYWYPQPWHTNLGNWYPRPEDFPNGILPLSEAAHRHGMKFVLWISAQQVRDGTQFAKEYPQFIHGGGEGRGGFWKYGDPEARRFLTDWLSERIQEWEVDIYREDLGIGLPPDEGPERVGVAEMHHVAGFYTVWSDLLKRNEGLLIDNCCGGGRRMDLEAMSRAFTLWRSDFNDIGEGLKGEEHWPLMGLADQVMVAGISLYFPLHTGPVWDMRPYSFRSAMSPGIVIYNDLDDEAFSTELAQQGIAELKKLRPLFLGDLYPLMELTLNQRDWYAYQLDRPDLGRGCAFFFRRPDSPYRSCEVRLRNIDPEATYLVSVTGETYMEPEPNKISGRDLVDPQVEIDSKPGSALLRYQRVAP